MMMFMIKEMMQFDNGFGRVVILREGVGFTVLYSVTKTPGVYRCRVHNSALYVRPCGKITACRRIEKNENVRPQKEIAC